MNIRVANLIEPVDFYSALFEAGPTVHKQEYANRMLEDPKTIEIFPFSGSFLEMAIKTGIFPLSIQ
ncbi:hypothetical protein [Rufibacter sp. LB8]|uniref:hypothetical protein n=1 Tax=Rufibacter sp. LB8 TaxID=2777781 RepID=UPI00178C27C8|nr:hypothetical protein [Rufibacter sp. LB8]